MINYVQAQSYDDKRCKCICPSINSVMNNSQEDNDRIMVIANAAQTKCDCDSGNERIIIDYH